MNRLPYLKKFLILLLIILSFVCLGLSAYLDSYLYQNSPSEPIPAEGKIYPRYVHHGAHVYLTKTENLVLDLSPLAFIIFFVVAVVLNVRWKWLTPSKRLND